MTRKHFELIARTLAQTRPPKLFKPAERRQWEKVVVGFGAMCTNLNPRFNHKIFLNAVGWDLDEGGENS